MILEVSWDGLWTLFFLVSHNFMVTALGSCVKWPLIAEEPVEVQDSRENNPSGLEESKEYASM